MCTQSPASTQVLQETLAYQLETALSLVRMAGPSRGAEVVERVLMCDLQFSIQIC